MADAPQWFAVLQTAGIVSSFLFTAYQVRKSRTTSVASNEIRLIELHRNLWKMTIDKPELMRPFAYSLTTEDLRLSIAEQRFVSLLFLHVSGAFSLQQAGELKRLGDFEGDLKDLLSMPAIRKFWAENKHYYDSRFVRFVDSCAPHPGTLPRPAAE